jgi:TatA/E family protein of Tat protein translocase
MFGTLGGPEVVLILVIALIVFGPRRLPEIGKSMGKMLAEFRKASNDFKRTIEDELEAEKAKESEPPATSLVATTPPESTVAPPPSTMPEAVSAPPAIQYAPPPWTPATAPAEAPPPPVVAPEEVIVSREPPAEKK